MTEQIKSAISEIENMRKFNYTLAPNEVFDLAIRSLNAWDEVLTELKETKEHATDLVKPKFLGKELKEITDMCFDEAICIINKHLSEIEK